MKNLPKAKLEHKTTKDALATVFSSMGGHIIILHLVPTAQHY